jgi:hypothetical protein
MAAWEENYNRRREQRYIEGELLRQLKYRCKRRALPFDLTAEYLEDLFEAQAGLCALTGIQMDFERSGTGKRSAYMASVDRIVPERGYVQGNVRWVIFAVNMALSNWGEAVFAEIARRYVAHTSV